MAALALEQTRPGAARHRARDHGLDQRDHGVALVVARCDSAVALSQLDLPARSRLCEESRPGTRSLSHGMGRAAPWRGRVCAQRRREAEHPGPGAGPPELPGPRRVYRCASNMSTGAPGALVYLSAWTSIAGGSSAGVSRTLASPPSTPWSPRSWSNRRTPPRGACSGSSTTAPPTAALQPRVASPSGGRISSSFICRFTPVGSIRLRLCSRSSSGRSSRLTCSNRCSSWRMPFLDLRRPTKPSPNLGLEVHAAGSRSPAGSARTRTNEDLRLKYVTEFPNKRT